MPNSQGFNEKIQLGAETSFKVPPGSPPTFTIPVINPSFKPAVQRFKSEALSGSAQPRVPIDGKIAMTGTFDLECNTSSVGPVLKGVMGPQADQGIAGNYDHIFTLGTLGSFFIEQQFNDITQFFLYKGVRFDKISFSFDPEGLMKATVSCQGASTTVSAVLFSTGTVTNYTTAQPISYLTATMTYKGVVFGIAQNVKIDIDRQMQAVKVIDGTNQLADLITQIAVVKGSFKALFPDATVFTDAINSTEVALELLVPASTLGFGMKITLNTLKLMPNGPTTNGPGGLVTGDFTFDAYGAASTSVYPAFMYSKGFATIVIGAGTTDTLVWKIDGGANLTTTLTAGAARTLAQIVTDINATAGFAAVATAVAENGRVFVFSKQVTLTGSASSVQIVSGNAAANLGFAIATYNGLSQHAVRIIVSNGDVTY